MILLAIYPVALITHLSGLIMVAGTTLVDFVITAQFWKQYKASRDGLAAAIPSTRRRFQRMMGIGLLFLIASGIYMMYATHGAYGEQIWFRIKFGIIIVIIANGIIVGRRQTLRLNKMLADTEGVASADGKLLKVKRSLTAFQISQLVLLLTILTLSVFKFN